jgi:RNase adaptor protein for sRNA GlmZ degradation
VLVVDIREHEFLRRFPRTYRSLKEKGLAVSLLFLEADAAPKGRRVAGARPRRARGPKRR